MSECWLSEDDAMIRLVRKVAELGTAAHVAKAAGCVPTLVSQALTGKKPIGPKLAKYLGLIAVEQRSYRYLPAEVPPE